MRPAEIPAPGPTAAALGGRSVRERLQTSIRGRAHPATGSVPAAGSSTGRNGAGPCLRETTPPLVTAAHQQLQTPLILVWDNLNTHISAVMTTLLQSHQDWLIVRLPAYVRT